MKEMTNLEISSEKAADLQTEKEVKSPTLEVSPNKKSDNPTIDGVFNLASSMSLAKSGPFS